MTAHEFDNDSNQAERRSVQRDTYLSRAEADADMVGGRWKKQTETRVTGTPTYPQQPESSPWARSLDEVVGAEPPFSIDIDFVGDLGGATAPSAAIETAPPERGGLSSTPADDPPQLIRRKRRRV
jgi:hypothetical protein